MTWLSLVTTVTLIFGFVGMGILGLLGVSLHTQGPDTTRQALNRRMLAAGGSAVGTAVLLPVLLMGSAAALSFEIGWVALMAFVAAMFASRLPTRVVTLLVFLTVALAVVIHLPPQMGTFNTVGLFIVASLALAKLTRSAILRVHSERSVEAS